MAELDIDGIFKALDDWLPGLGLEEMEAIAEENKEWAEVTAKKLVDEFSIDKKANQSILNALQEAFVRGANSASDILQNSKLAEKSESQE